MMKKSAAIAATAIVVGFAAPGSAGLPGMEPQRQNNLCYTACRIECQYLNQGDQAAITQCYVQCAIDKCGAAG